MAKEKEFQSKLIKDLNTRFPGCLVVKNDPTYIQGIPDLLVLFNDHWAALECKASLSESQRPNQKYYVDRLDKMSFASFICPENKEEVLNGLQQAFRDSGNALIP